MTTHATLGKHLQELRKGSGISQGKLSKALGYSSPQFVSNWERGTCKPPTNKIDMFAAVVKCDVKKLKEKIIEILLKDYEEQLRDDLFPKKSKKST